MNPKKVHGQTCPAKYSTLQREKARGKNGIQEKHAEF
jgi:hypothetical protein